jgi:hypothetical protein
MAEQSDENTIAKLVEALHSDEAYNREAAIKKIIKSNINDERVIDVLHQIANNDPNKAVRNFARSALKKFGVEHSEVAKDEPVAITTRYFWEPSPETISSSETVTGWRWFLTEYLQLILGFVGWYIVNGLFFYFTIGLDGENFSTGENFSIICATFPLNLIVLIGSAVIVPRLAFGILLAMVVNLVIATILGEGSNAMFLVPFFQLVY